MDRRWLVAGLLVFVFGALFMFGATRLEGQSAAFVYGGEYNKYIRLDVRPGSAQPGQLLKLVLNDSVWSLCGTEDCSDVVVVDSSGTVLPYTVAGRYVVRIHNPNSEDLDDFQVRVVVDTNSLITHNLMRPDCGDIRFYDALGNKVPYWIESGCGTSKTVIWIKVPHIPASGDVNVYMHYGDFSLTSESSGDAVFEFFDGFDGSEINVSKWHINTTSTSSVSVSGGDAVFHVWGTCNDIFSSLTSGPDLYSVDTSILTGNKVLEALVWYDVRRGIRWHGGIGNYSNTSHFSLFGLYARDNTQVEGYYGRYIWGGSIRDSLSGYPGILRIVHLDGTEDRFYKVSADYLSVRHVVDYRYWAGDKGVHIFLKNWSCDDPEDVYMHVDWVRVRKYAPEEPVVTVSVDVPFSLYVDPKYDGEWSSKSLYILLGSDRNAMSLRSEVNAAKVGQYEVLVNAPSDVVLYDGSASVSISPDTDAPGEKNVSIRLFSAAPTGVHRSVCDVEVHDPLQPSARYHLDANSDTVMFSYVFSSEGVYTIDYNCYVFMTKVISGFAVHSVYIPDPSTPSLSLSVSGLPSSISTPTSTTLSVSVTSDGSPADGVDCYVTYEGNVFHSVTSQDGVATFELTLSPGTEGTVVCYKSGYHPAETTFIVSSAGQGTQPGGGGGFSSGGFGGSASGTTESGHTVQVAAPVSSTGGVPSGVYLLVALGVVAALVFLSRRH